MIRMPRFRPLPQSNVATRYGVALALFALSLAIRLAADGAFPPGFPFLTFFPAVIAATFLCGRGPGFVAAALGGWAAWHWFIGPPDYAFNARVAVALGFYGFVVIVDVLLIDALMRRQRLLTHNEAELGAMAAQQTLLFTELQHRVANNLANVAAMLRMERRAIERDPAGALAAIDRATVRIELMGRVHRQLHDPDARRLGLGEQVARAAQAVREVAGADGVALDVAVDEAVRLDPARRLPLVLLITELVTNSCKHAFAPDQADPRVRIALGPAPGPAGRMRLTVADNGRGLDPNAPPTRPAGTRGIGAAIIAGFVAQLDGTMAIEGTSGVTTAVDFPQG